MYSRYIPNPRGGYDRRLVPDPPAEPLARGNKEQATGDKRKIPAGPGSPGPQFPAGAGVPDGPPLRPPPFSSRPPPIGQPSAILGPNGLLGNFLPRGLDTEDLLVLAVLILAMKQDGAGPAELLIAAALYLWLQ